MTQTEAQNLKSGDKVTRFGHVATVMHVYETTANIKYDNPVRGMSPQVDEFISSLTVLQKISNDSRL